MGEYQEAQDAEGLTPTMYILGKVSTDNHTHVFYLRDDLPIATTDAHEHAHSISKGPGHTVICGPADDHIHTVLSLKESGDYALRGLFNG